MHLPFSVPPSNSILSAGKFVRRLPKSCEKIVPLGTKYYAVESENGTVHVSEPVGVVNDRIEEDIFS
ncbi:hypothetical protein TB1_031211 [Malus domestica]